MNQGFFKIEPCGESCRLSSGCRTPKMPVTGKGKLGILIVAEAPGEREDEKGIQLIGPAGQILRSHLHKHGIDLDRDCRKTNVVRCRPPKNRKPFPTEIAACVPHVWEEIERFKPKLILLLGQTAVDGFMLDRFAKADVGQIGKWRGLIIPDQKARAWVCPMFHPSYVLRMTKARISPIEKTFSFDIERALNYLHKPFPKTETLNIKIYRSISLWMFRGVKKFAFDFETTGLRPWREDKPKILCCGIAWENNCISFPMTRDNARVLKALLIDGSIKKVAHNMKFELTWAKYCLGVETKGWIWDSMIASHLLDNRKGITGLKFQAYAALGIEDWSKGVDVKELISVSDKVLRYNAKDAWWTYQLYRRQRKMFE